MKRFEIVLPMDITEAGTLLELPRGSTVLSADYDWWKRTLTLLVEAPNGKPRTDLPNVVLKDAPRGD